MIDSYFTREVKAISGKRIPLSSRFYERKLEPK